MSPSISAWTFQISSGDITSPDGIVTRDCAYSGNGQFINNANFTGLKEHGPIPIGEYRMVRAFEPRMGSIVFALFPSPINVMYGRSLFYIHADNKFHNNSASEGCIVVTLAIREAMEKSECQTLLVIV